VKPSPRGELSHRQVATVVGERLLYLPSAGACLLASHAAHEVWRHNPYRSL
jgi:hypothetical protein